MKRKDCQHECIPLVSSDLYQAIKIKSKNCAHGHITAYHLNRSFWICLSLGGIIIYWQCGIDDMLVTIEFDQARGEHEEIITHNMDMGTLHCSLLLVFSFFSSVHLQC